MDREAWNDGCGWLTQKSKDQDELNHLRIVEDPNKSRTDKSSGLELLCPFLGVKQKKPSYEQQICFMPKNNYTGIRRGC